MLQAAGAPTTDLHVNLHYEFLAYLPAYSYKGYKHFIPSYLSKKEMKTICLSLICLPPNNFRLAITSNVLVMQYSGSFYCIVLKLS